jgi:hypothetical protein
MVFCKKFVMVKNVSATEQSAELMDCVDAEEDGNS